MTHFWFLPFGMIRFWLAAGIFEWIRTPNSPRDSFNAFNTRPSRN